MSENLAAATDLNADTSQASLAPTSGGQRIVAIDVLRGVVLLGILVMNIPFMGWPEAWVFESLHYKDDTGLERGLWFASEVFANQRMMTIFSLLFGAGIVLVADRAIAAGKSPAALHYKRMLVLALFGLVHGLLMWYGDILLAYAIVGSAAYLFRRLPARWLAGIGFSLIVITLAISLAVAGLFAMWAQGDPAGYAAFEMVEAETIPHEIAAYRGGVVDQFHARWPTVVFMQVFIGPLMLYWWVGGMMLLGMAAMKSKLITGQRSAKTYGLMLGVGFGIGIPLACGYAAYKLSGRLDDFRMQWVGESVRMAIALIVAGGWVGGVLLLCKQSWFARVSHPLASVGRMALTNYLGQTLLVTFIFYGHGLGHFAKLERPAMMLVVLGVWALQLIVSPLWLRRFKYGPMEWLWRSLTYARFQPMMRKA